MERQSKKASRPKRDEAFEAWRADETKKEPSIKWQYSMAKKLLYKDLRAGKVPLEELDAHNKSTMPLKKIYIASRYQDRVMGGCRKVNF